MLFFKNDPYTTLNNNEQFTIQILIIKSHSPDYPPYLYIFKFVVLRIAQAILIENYKRMQVSCIGKALNTR